MLCAIAGSCEVNSSIVKLFKFIGIMMDLINGLRSQRPWRQFNLGSRAPLQRSLSESSNRNLTATVQRSSQSIDGVVRSGGDELPSTAFASINSAGVSSFNDESLNELATSLGMSENSSRLSGDLDIMNEMLEINGAELQGERGWT